MSWGYWLFWTFVYIRNQYWIMVGLEFSNLLIFSLGDSNLLPLFLCSFIGYVLVSAAALARLDLGINRWASRCVGMAAAGLTFDQVEPVCSSVSVTRKRWLWTVDIAIFFPVFPWPCIFKPIASGEFSLWASRLNRKGKRFLSIWISSDLKLHS